MIKYLCWSKFSFLYTKLLKIITFFIFMFPMSRPLGAAVGDVSGGCHSQSGSPLGAYSSSRGLLAMSGDIFEWHNWRQGMLLCPSGKGTGMPLNSLQCTAPLHVTRSFLTWNVSSIEPDTVSDADELSAHSEALATAVNSQAVFCQRVGISHCIFHGPPIVYIVIVFGFCLHLET